LDMVFDTGSDWLVVASHTCKSCNGKKYNHGGSSSLKTFYNEDKIVYGSAQADGYYARDLVCSLDSENSCTDMTFLMMTQQRGLDFISGIVGMTSGLYPNSAPLLVNELYQDDKIDENVFGFYLGGTDEDSSLDIGFINDQAMRDPSELVWMDVIDGNFWWTSYLTGVMFVKPDGSELPLSFSIDNELAMTDTGTSCTYFPSKHYNDIIGMLMTIIPEWYIDEYGDLGVDCSVRDKLPSIYFLVGGYWLEMQSKDWIVETDGKCWTCLGENPIDEYWILGDTFLRGYYSVHRYGENSA
jgi:hypothetical protein